MTTMHRRDSLEWVICKTSLFPLLIAAAVLLCPRPAVSQDLTTTNPYVNLPRPADDPRWAEAFKHWDKREDTEEAEAAIKLFELMAAEKPDCFECHLWLCRANFLMAMRKIRSRDDFCEKSIEAGDRALEIKPDSAMTKYWRYSSMVMLRDLTEEQYEEVREMAVLNKQLRPLPETSHDPLWAQAIKKFDARTDPGQARAAIDDFEEIEKRNPDRIEPKMHLAFLYYSLGERDMPKEEKAALFLQGAGWARKAVSIEPRNGGANYLLCSTLGSYAENVGMLSIAMNAMEITKALIIVVEENPTFLYGGFSRYLAAALSVAGEISFRFASMFGFPEELIIRMTVFSARFEPNCVDNHYQLAEMYISLDRMGEAKKALETALAIDPSVLKYYEAENRIVQARAKERYEELFGKGKKK